MCLVMSVAMKKKAANGNFWENEEWRWDTVKWNLSWCHPEATICTKCFTNNSPSQHNSSRSLASSFSPLFQSRGSTLYGSLCVCVCVQFCSHCMCSLADPQEHCTRFVILTYPSDCSKDGSWFLAGFWIRSHIYKVTSTQLIFITKAHLKNKTQNAE